ncbi:MAG: DUF554 domain-containing protein [Desulfonatronovibrionaceae bacterium]
MNLPVGTLINALAVIAGSGVGLCLGARIPDRVHKTVIHGIGLATLLIGMQMALEVRDILLLVFSVLVGALAGEALDLEKHLNRLVNILKKRIGSKNKNFSQGLITAFLIYCIGSLTILGALDEGLRNDPTLLLTKSVLDGFTSIALASTYGLGVMFSAVPLLIYQGTITILAGYFQAVFTPVLIAQLTGVGGILVLGLGLTLLEIREIKITNLLPALVMVFILQGFL